MTLVSVKPQHGRYSFPHLSTWFDGFVENEFPKGNLDTSALVNTKETKDNFSIEVAAPGYQRDQFKIEVVNQTLTISGEATAQEDEEGDKWTRREYQFSNFKRSFSLPKTVNAEKIKAAYREGILYVTLPKMEEAKGKERIEVKVS